MVDQGTGQERPAGWKRDPSGRHYGRYWDGERWTDQVVSADKVRGIDPLPETQRPRRTEADSQATRVTPSPAPPTEVMPATPKISGPVPAAPGWKPDPPPSRRPLSRRPADPDDARGAGRNQVLDAVRAWPRWTKWAAGAAVVLVLLAAAAGGGEDADRPVSVVGEVQTTLTLPVVTTAVPTTQVATTIPATTQAPTTVTTPATTQAPATTAATAPATTAATAPPATAVYYPNCAAVRAAGKAPIYQGQPGYRAGLDRDGDGIACDT